jgi:hypothetical protein
VVVIAASLVGAGFVIRSFVLNDQARVIPTAEVVDRFHADNTTTSVATSVPAEPSVTTTDPAPPDSGATRSDSSPTEPRSEPDLVSPGVYAYETTGGEEIDAVGGARHAYPDRTTITVLPYGCGVSLRWDVLRERWEEWRICATSAGIELQTEGVSYHEFFGTSETEDLRCDVGVLLVATGEQSKTPVEQVCSLADEPWFPVWTVLGRSTRSIDGAEIEVQQVQMRIEDDDEYWEYLVLDWYLAPNGLPVEVTQTKSSRSDTFVGPVEYVEEYHLVLTSMDPLP